MFLFFFLNCGEIYLNFIVERVYNAYFCKVFQELKERILEKLDDENAWNVNIGRLIVIAMIDIYLCSLQICCKLLSIYLNCRFFLIFFRYALY